MSASNLARTTFAIAAVAAGTFAAASTLGSNTAEAKKLVIKVGHVHHVHRHVFRPRVIVPLVAASYVGGCFWLREKAAATDSAYWWNRYHFCRGY